MKIKELLSGDAVLSGGGETEISGISYDSREVKKGDLFFALAGHNTDGKNFVSDALAKGAAAVAAAEKIDNLNAPQITARDIFSFMSAACAKFYKEPDKEMFVAGITGTNGKTTISYMLESILKHNGKKCGVIGTVNYRYGDKIIEAKNTTPQAPDIYKIMRESAGNSIKHLIMEVSSHALSLGRVKGIEFDAAVWTNLTQDHLDFHKNMENYYKAKASLFTGLKAGAKKNKYAIINADDECGEKLAAELSKANPACEIILYSAKKKSDLSAENVLIKSEGSEFEIKYKNLSKKAAIKHVGLHNVYNALAAVGAAVSCGISFENAVEGLNGSAQAPGRLERVDFKSGFGVFVDYAHTDDALKNALLALRKIPHNRIITVFGCGGDRDRTKRPKMGKVSVEESDFVFVTSDNPRSEDPGQIILDVEVGIKRAEKTNYKVVIDREEAVKQAVDMAQKGDIVLIAGKGHETYQIVGKEKLHFNDIETALKYLKIKEAAQNAKFGRAQEEFDF